VFNKYIEDKGGQLTAVLYVDDIVITCANDKAIVGFNPIQTGLEITIGRGPVFTASWKQVLVTKHSMEAELVGFSDSMGLIIWTREFLIEQGYKIGAAIVYQDNKSTMALITKGEMSSKGTRHIDIRYFFISEK
jgi:hypothetical protein